MSGPDFEQQQYTSPASGSVYDPVTPVSGEVPPPPPPRGFGYGPGVAHGANPALAGLLGFIPGVGAMYNGQFAKGIAHIVIFAIFGSLSNHVNGIFGLLVAGWVFYMAFEAYQTARARREGLPIPDPFGLNNIGERFGFHGNPDFTNFWQGGGANINSQTHVDANGSVYRTRTDTSGRTTTYQVDPAGNVSKSTTQGVPYAGYPPAQGYPEQSYVPPVPPSPPGYAAYGMPPYQAPPQYGVPPVPPQYGVPPVPPMPPARSGLPTGAIWLIGLGVFALLGSLHPFAFLEGEATGGLFLMALGVFLFFRRYQGPSGLPQDAATTQWTMARALRSGGTVFLVGLLTLLQGVHVIQWETSWPFLLIFFGVVTLLERTAANRAMNLGYPPQPYAPVPVAEPAAAPQSPLSIIPQPTRPADSSTGEEGR